MRIDENEISLRKISFFHLLLTSVPTRGVASIGKKNENEKTTTK